MANSDFQQALDEACQVFQLNGWEISGCLFCSFMDKMISPLAAIILHNNLASEKEVRWIAKGCDDGEEWMNEAADEIYKLYDILAAKFQAEVDFIFNFGVSVALNWPKSEFADLIRAKYIKPSNHRY